jgi:transcriptional regulator GlxA family with amidase domain
MDALLGNAPHMKLSEVADALGVDRHTIENAMRSVRKTTFREYRRKGVLLAAEEMLDQSSLSVKEIGVKLGFASAASFSRFIRQTTGKSPSQLRKSGIFPGN